MTTDLCLTKLWVDLAGIKSDQRSIAQIANVSNVENANNVRHLRNNNVPTAELRPFPQILTWLFSRWLNCLQICHQIIQFPLDLLSISQICHQIAVTVSFAFVRESCRERMLCASNFSLWSLLIGFRLGPLFLPVIQFTILLQSLRSFCRKFSTKCLSKRGYKLLDYHRTPLFDLIKSFLRSRILIAYGSDRRGKKIYLETVQPLMVRPSLRGADFKSVISRTHYFRLSISGLSILAPLYLFLFWFNHTWLQDTWWMLMWCSWTIRAGHVW